ncbi:MAG TPA: NifB/NifX family molybdenum-iron cluster-binding protein [Symbiobacteriaceae bacterium]|jgi:predicted Fe-Mo cluster-binding NifX family protein
MRIAIPVSDGQVANHLGMAQSFLIADVEDGKVVQEVELPNPGHGPGGPPPIFLARLGVKQVVAWGMPEHAQGMFTSAGVQVQMGATGEPKQVLRDFLCGTLKVTDEKLNGGGGCGCGDEEEGHDH